MYVAPGCNPVIVYDGFVIWLLSYGVPEIAPPAIEYATPLRTAIFVVQLAVMLVEVVVTTGLEMVRTGVRATVKVPDLVASCVLVAVTVTEVPVDGAVNTPAELMLPPETDQLTVFA